MYKIKSWIRLLVRLEVEMASIHDRLAQLETNEGKMALALQHLGEAIVANNKKLAELNDRIQSQASNTMTEEDKNTLGVVAEQSDTLATTAQQLVDALAPPAPAPAPAGPTGPTGEAGGPVG